MSYPSDLDKLADEIQRDRNQFWAARGFAIQAYADLEQSLCRLFAHLSGTGFDVAAIIFFKITSAGARDTILDRLLKKKHGDTYAAFWNSFQTLVRQVTHKRNEIVHWNAINEVGASGPKLKLTPPNFWDFDENSPSYTTDDFYAFMKLCDYLCRFCNMFWWFIAPLPSAQRDAATVQTWRDIFQQPAVYPPPSNHPLSPTPQAPETQPPPSQELPPAPAL
jgi:hypothetical protein